MKYNKHGFTLVELLAVIVILAIILVIAVPKVMSVIEDAKKATLESTAKMIASAAEKAKVQNTVLGKDKEIKCEDVVKLNDVDYENCLIIFEDNTAKVTIEGSGKFEGLYVCDGTKGDSRAQEESCPPIINAVSFAADDWATIVAAVQSGKYPYKVGNEKSIDLGSFGIHTVRVANTTTCEGLSLKSETGCGFVLEFVDIIKKNYMSSNSTTIGGWPASDIRKILNDGENSIYNAIPEDLRKGIIKTKVVSSHFSGDTENLVDGNFLSEDNLYLLTLEEVYGSEASFTIYETSLGSSRQLDYYKKLNVTYSEYSGAIKTGEWWLRSVSKNMDSYFDYVRTDGSWGQIYPTTLYGISPAFRIGE